MKSKEYNAKILVVDDEEMILKMFDEFLSSLDYRVYKAFTAEEGLDILKKESIDVIISDYKMPGLTGTQFLETVNMKYPDTVRIMITGFPDLQNAKEAINKCGVFKYLVKPVNMEELKESINFSVQYLVLQRKKSNKLVRLEENLNRLIQLSLAFSNESEIDNLLQMIIYEAKKFTSADTAILYLVKNDNLIVKEIISDKLGSKQIEELLNSKIDIEGKSVSQFVAKSGEIIRIEDTNEFQFGNIIDIKSNYPFNNRLNYKSILGVPIKNNVLKVLGVIQLINSENEEGEFIAFQENDEEIVRSLSSLAGASLQNLQLINELQENSDRKNKFLTILGHELRTPVAILSEYINILAEGMVDDEEMREQIVRTSQRNIENMKEMVEDIINIAKKNYTGTFEKVSVKNIIKKALSTFYAGIKERKLSIQMSKCDDVVLEADSRKLVILLKNLISNAIKYTPDGGTIKFFIRKIDYIAEIVVKDSGIGIPKDKIEKIFDGFTQIGDENIHSTSKTKFLGGGIGLGLYISRQIVEEHGGKIWAESEGENKGSKFIVNIPINQNYY